jgi:chromosome segregation ATPase
MCEIRRFAVLCCCLALLAGCSSEGKPAKESTKAIEGLASTRDALVRAKAQVSETTSALNDLASEGGDLRAEYQKFSTLVEETERDAERARKRAQEMRERTKQYVSEWQKEMSDVQSPELRAGAEERRRRIQDNFDAIAEAARHTREAYEPYMQNLKDIQKALAMDLTPSGVQMARPATEKARADAKTLDLRFDQLIAELDRVSAGMSAGRR